MKTLNELYHDITANEALKAEFLALKTPEDIVAFAKKNDCDATLDDIRTFFKDKQHDSGELSEDALEKVAGGGNQTTDFIRLLLSLGESVNGGNVNAC